MSDALAFYIVDPWIETHAQGVEWYC
jgi:hypothetical protein